jgi:hypothetical protein
MTEQMPPTTSWGTSFLAVRYAKQTAGDPVIVLADENNTVVSVNGSQVATLAAGEAYGDDLMTAGGNVGALIETSKPALVTQFMTNNHYLYNAVDATGDPSAMLVPPYQQYLDSYTLATPGSGFGFNAINVAVPTATIGSFRLDGAPVDASQFAPIGGTAFSSAQLKVASGTHTVRADQPFGAFAYGANDYNSYAYPGGAGLSPVAAVDHVTVAPASQNASTGQQACVTATAYDASNQPVEGVRADLSVTGANAGAVANATTDAQGEADLCYTGASDGTDTVTATVGTHDDTATITWTSAPVTPTPPAAPAAPTAVAGDEAAKVTWAAPNANGSTITGYTVTAAPGGRSCDAAADATDCVVYGLTNGTAYTFTVVAHSSTGDSTASAASAPATPTPRLNTELQTNNPAPAPGQSVTLTARGYQPGSTVTFVLESTPTTLGTAVVDGNGVASLTVTVPSGLSGRHTVFAVGTAADGTPLSQAVALNVANASGLLALTGQGSWIQVAFWLGGAMVVAGTALLVAMRRKGWSLAALRRRLALR